MLNYTRLALCATLWILLLGGVPDCWAQSSVGENPSLRRGMQSAPGQLPSWAAPKARPNRKADRGMGISPTPQPYDSPERPPVPVDGGLVWLTAAGAAYAARELSKRRGASDTDEDDA